ncbi:MAG: hypothetical protein WB723_15640 [Candidatus Acidiferrales bacterium]
MQDVENKVADDSIEKRITEEEGPPHLGGSAPGANAYEIEKARNHKSRKGQYIDNPVANRAIRSEVIKQLKTLCGGTAENGTDHDSCGNPQKEFPVVS